MKASQGAGGVFDVDWKYVPGQDTPPVRIGYYYCFAYFDQNSQNNYASSVFAAPMALDTDIMGKDFAQFVKEKYQSGERGEKVTGTCYAAESIKRLPKQGSPIWKQDGDLASGSKPDGSPQPCRQHETWGGIERTCSLKTFRKRSVQKRERAVIGPQPGGYYVFAIGFNITKTLTMESRRQRAAALHRMLTTL